MNRKTFAFGLLSATVAIALNACGDRKKPIVGKWRVDDIKDRGEMIFEFQENGTMQITMKGNPFLSAKYELVGDQISINSGDGVISNSSVKVEGDRMTMTQKNGNIQIFNRVK
jgi:uncharacterized protein (TIGR03066 family)